MLDGCLPGTQWAAVTTHCEWTKVPPQKGNPLRVLIWACHGQAPWGAWVPPTIRPLGLYPHCPVPPPLPPFPPPHKLQLFAQFSFMYTSYMPLQYPFPAQTGHPSTLSAQPANDIGVIKTIDLLDNYQSLNESNNHSTKRLTTIKRCDGLHLCHAHSRIAIGL